jgi:H+/Cl- antiporter ClcA
LVLVAVVFGINLLPAFGPPTWAVLVFTRLHWHLNPVALVLLGALAAMAGRYLLARLARHFKGRLPGRPSFSVAL